MYKNACLRDEKWKDDAPSGDKSEKLLNPGKEFFLKLAAKVVKDMNHMKDKNGISYARKSMIMTGLSLNIDGV